MSSKHTMILVFVLGLVVAMIGLGLGFVVVPAEALPKVDKEGVDGVEEKEGGVEIEVEGEGEGVEMEDTFPLEGVWRWLIGTSKTTCSTAAILGDFIFGLVAFPGTKGGFF